MNIDLRQGGGIAPSADLYRAAMQPGADLYDRSLEYFLIHAWENKFNPDQRVDGQVIGRMFIHVHGQLGMLPEIGGGLVVPYGGAYPAGIEDEDVQRARQAIKIVHEPAADDAQFVQARQAIAEAERVIFLGFGFHPRNVERLHVHRIGNGAELYICAYGLSENQQKTMIRPWSRPHPGYVVGKEHEDVSEFLRQHPQALG